MVCKVFVSFSISNPSVIWEKKEQKIFENREAMPTKPYVQYILNWPYFSQQSYSQSR